MRRLFPRLLSSTALTRVGLAVAGLMGFSGGGDDAYALPQQGQVVGGSATISQSSPSELDINQSTARAVIDWQSFSIGGGETTRFVQPGASSIAVNRVTGVDPSQIMGRLVANGQVVLVNPNGILFGKGAQVNVGGLVASTAGITNQNAMQGKLVFDQAGNPNAAIVNAGTITARTGGLVALVAPSVANSGVIRAKLGHIALSSGDKWTLDLYGDRLVSFDVTDQVNGNVTNTGKIAAGTVEVTANQAKGIVGNAINMGGVVEATGVHNEGGTIVLDGGDNGDVSVTGTLKVSSPEASGVGGQIGVTGNNVTLSGATLDASGANGGGTIDVGGYNPATKNTVIPAKSLPSTRSGAGIHPSAHAGGRHGSPAFAGDDNLSLRQANSVTVDAASKLVADAITAGNGGSITVWSDGDTSFNGSASAKGGSQSGAGGSIETSGHMLSVDGARIDTSAANGTTGNWLLDPYDLSITASGASAISTALASSNVTVQTTAATSGTSSASGYGSAVSGSGGNISVNSAISWSSANSLTLSAYNSILVNAAISDSGTGNVVLRADNTGLDASGLGGAASVVNSASISTGGAVSIYYDSTNYAAPVTYSGITAGGGSTAYMLVNSVADLNNVQNNLSGTYALGNNITGIGAFSPIGNGATAFSGIFDGNGGIATYSLSGATISGSSYVGLFGNSSGTIRNVTSTGEVVSATASGSSRVGGLVGYNSGTLTGDSFSGTIIAGSVVSYLGALVGQNSGKVIGDTAVSVTISVGAGAYDVGGLVGWNSGNNVVVSNSSALAGVTINEAAGGIYFGGLVGLNNNNAQIISDYAADTISAGGAVNDMGGIVGYLDCSVAASTFVGTLIDGSGANSIGGLVGGIPYFSGNLRDSVFGGTILAGVSATAGTAAQYVGGLVGNSAGIVSGAGMVSGLISVGYGSQDVGGLVGYATGTGSLITGGLVRAATVLSPGAGSTNVGGLVGYNDAGSTISGGTALEGVSANYRAGGMVGYNAGLIAGITAMNSVTAGNSAQYVGGLVGLNNGTVSSAGFAGNLSVGSGANAVGGLVGQNLGTVSAVTGSGNVTFGSAASHSAGLVGWNTTGTAVVSNAVYSGTVTFGSNAAFSGGVIGALDAGSATGVTLTGEVIAGGGLTAVGGVVGIVNGTTLTSAVMAAGSLLSAGNSVNAVGGLVGENLNSGMISNVTGAGNVTIGNSAGHSAGLIGWNTAVGGAISNAGFAGTVTFGSNAAFSGGAIGALDAGSATGVTLTGEVIAGANSTAIGGIAGVINGTVLKNTTVNGTVLAGSGSIYIGGVVGDDVGGTISAATVASGLISAAGSQDVGGLIGYSGYGSGTGTVFSIASGLVQAGVAVSGATAVGGLVGYNDVGSTISGGTALEAVSGITNVGGICGRQYRPGHGRYGQQQCHGDRQRNRDRRAGGV